MEKTSFLNRSVKGVGWLAGSQAGAQIAHVAFRLLLAILLTPADFGLLAMAMTYMGFAYLLGGLGFGQALIQHKELTEAHRSSAFWFVTGAALILAVVGVATAGLLADLFGEPDVADILRVLPWLLVISVPTNILEALLLRELSFRSVAMRHLVAAVASGIAGVTLALLGAGVWSLIAHRIVTVVATFLFLARASTWHPKLLFERRAIRDLMGFGLNLSGARVLSAAGRQLPNIVIGRLLGSSYLGLFSLAYQIVLLPLQFIARPIEQVMLPVLAKLVGEQERRLSAYIRVQSVLLLAAGALLGLALPLAPAMVSLVLGARWAQAGPVMQIFVFLAAVRLALRMAPTLLLSHGHANAVLRWNILTTILQAAGITVGVAYGFSGAIGGWVGGGIVASFYPVVALAGVEKLSARQQLGPVARATVAAAASCGVAFLLSTVLPGGLAGFAVTLVVCSLVYVGATRIVMPTSWDSVRTALVALRIKETKKGISPSSPGATPD